MESFNGISVNLGNCLTDVSLGGSLDQILVSGDEVGNKLIPSPRQETTVDG